MHGGEEESPVKSNDPTGFKDAVNDDSDNTGENFDEDSNENPLLQAYVQKMNTLTKHPSKPNSPSPKLRPLENKGMSPIEIGKNLRALEETKSDR